MTGTLAADGDRYTLRFERTLRHPPELVWRALTESAELAHWFPAKIDGLHAGGGSLRFAFPPQPGQSVAATPAEEFTGLELGGELRRWEPPRLLEYTWDEDVLRFELTPHDAGTILVFVTTFTDVSKAARDAAGWEICLTSLASRLAGEPIEPYSEARWRVLFDGFAAKFGAEASASGLPGE